MKTCAQCGETKPLTEYTNDCRRNDGRYPWCKPCKRSYYNARYSRHPRTNNGHVAKDGYRILYRPDHPNAKANGYIREHVVVMSEMLGRPLLQGENVHHINGIRDDNRPENLELWSTSQPKGQRVVDKVRWAHEIIERYSG